MDFLSTERALADKLYWSIKGAQIAGYFCLCSSPSLGFQFSLKLALYISLKILFGLFVTAQFVHTLHRKLILQGAKFTKTDFITSATILFGLGYFTLIKLRRLTNWRGSLQFWSDNVHFYRTLQDSYGVHLDSCKADCGPLHRATKEIRRNFYIYACLSLIVVAFRLLTFVRFSDYSDQQKVSVSTTYSALGILDNLFPLFVSLFVILHHLGLQHYVFGYIKLVRASFETIGNRLDRFSREPGSKPRSNEHEHELHEHKELKEPLTGPASDGNALTISAYHHLEDYIQRLNTDYGKLLLVEIMTVTWCSIIALFQTVAQLKDANTNGSSGPLLIGNVTSSAFMTFINLLSLFNLCHEGEHVTTASTYVCKLLAVGLEPQFLSCDGYLTLNKRLFVQVLKSQN